LFLFFPEMGVAQSESSVYKVRPWDWEAGDFGDTDGIKDVSEALQRAINEVKETRGAGIVFLPEGTYRISRTIYVPKAIRLIGYGKKRPVIVLSKNSPGFQTEPEGDKGRAKYMIWFTDRIVRDEQAVPDAGAGTFYSALSNIDLKIEDGNPCAVALRTHFAQHSFISHCNILIGNGKAGLFDVGNEMENVRFYGGDYGIYTTKASPGWQVMLTDVYFEGQRKAAIRTQEAGLTIVRMTARKVPAVVEVDPNYWEKLFVEDSSFEQVSGAALVIGNEGNASNQITLRNVCCRDVPVLAEYRRSGQRTLGVAANYRVRNYRHGLQLADMAAVPEMQTVADLLPESADLPPLPPSDIPALPDVSHWANVRKMGAYGDGKGDDTQVFKEAIEHYETIYVPQGWYVINEPLVLGPKTKLIGLHPMSTQLILKESTPAFSGFGGPVPMIETPIGGDNVLTGIGICTGGYNYRAVGVKWQSGEHSYMNDVKFVGGHGTMNRGPEQPWRWQAVGVSSPERPVTAAGRDLAWDNQYWSLWINGGGGTFKNIWSASTYSAAGVRVSHTAVPGRIYALSVEHHVRNEVTFQGVKNWKVYALQLEEETRESIDCQPVELVECEDMVFANLYAFQVIKVATPYPQAVRTWNCRNIEVLNFHNYAQTKYVAVNSLYDVNSGREVRPWEFNRLLISGDEPVLPAPATAPAMRRLATGFEFSGGTTSDSRGNVYFCETRMRRIYRWSVDSEQVSLVADFPWEPLSLACDSEDRLLVIFKYTPQPGYLVDGEQERAVELPDRRGTSFSMWGNSGFEIRAFAMDPERPEESIIPLEKKKIEEVNGIYKALYPSDHWRDFHDFNTNVTYWPENCFVAPDGVTIIPEQYDLAQASALLEAFPGRPFYASDQYDKRVVRLQVDARGRLSDLEYFVEKGEFGTAVDASGNLYIADGQIYIYNPSGEAIGRIDVPERPLTLRFGGRGQRKLFINTHRSLYVADLGDW
jgi:hypothetical protein